MIQTTKQPQSHSPKTRTVTILFLGITVILGILFALTWYFNKKPDTTVHNESTAQDRTSSFYLGSSPRELLNQKEKRDVTLYFLDSLHEGLVGESRKIVQQVDVVSELRETLLCLLSGSSHNLPSPIPRGTKLREVYLDVYQTAYLDFTKELSENHVGGLHEEILTVYSILKTVIDNFPQVASIQILIEGKERTTLKGHVSINNPLRLKDFSLFPAINNVQVKGKK